MFVEGGTVRNMDGILEIGRENGGRKWNRSRGWKVFVQDFFWVSAGGASRDEDFEMIGSTKAADGWHVMVGHTHHHGTLFTFGLLLLFLYAKGGRTSATCSLFQLIFYFTQRQPVVAIRNPFS